LYTFFVSTVLNHGDAVFSLLTKSPLDRNTLGRVWGEGAEARYIGALNTRTFCYVR